MELLLHESFKPNHLEFPDYVEQNWLPFVSEKGIELATYRIRSTSPRALLFYLHGFLSYSLEFIQLGYVMAKENIDVFALDFVGHGKSQGLKNYFDDFDSLVQDAVNYVKKVEEVYGGLPIFLSGTSMGGTVTINVSQQVLSQGMILFSPALGAYKESNCCLSSLLCCFACFCPKLSLPNKLPLPPNRNFAAIEELNTNQNIRRDMIRPGSLKELIDGMKKTNKKVASITTPFVLIQGGSDYISSSAKAHQFFISASSEDKDYWFYPEMHHIAHLEPEYEEILERLKEWINQRIIRHSR